MKTNSFDEQLSILIQMIKDVLYNIKEGEVPNESVKELLTEQCRCLIHLVENADFYKKHIANGNK